MKKSLVAALGVCALFSGSTMAADGEAVYNKVCVACHASGAAGAPKMGDGAAWEPRIAKGMDALYQSANTGVPGTAMMPKGNCLDCSGEDLQAAVDFMVGNSKQ
ncbi:c-type cytochrome [Thiohalomonas denitrificans]|uniref:c-type cytochrome n=1 Tax=Thiohalomonas denitrificans TaxID=415747 RepID=UPI0026F0873C|nr:c-type cytochrome [Thiohalomonas denitrificans]